MKKLYYLLFYKLNCFFKTISDDSWSDWKAGLVIQTLQIFILLIFAGQMDLITKNNPILDWDPKMWGIPIAFGLALFNYSIFLHQRGWEIYEDEFKIYSKQKNIIINIIVFCIVFVIPSLLFYTYYQYSQVDWSKYR